MGDQEEAPPLGAGAAQEQQDGARGGQQAPPAKDMEIPQARRSLLQSQQEITWLEGANQALRGQVQNGPPADMAAIKNIAPNKVPFWPGSPSDPQADVWIAQVTKLRGINKWSENQTLDAIYLSLQGPVAKWYKALVQDKTYSQIDNFEKFQDHFLACF